MNNSLSRRDMLLLAGAGLAAGATVIPEATGAAETTDRVSPETFRYCLNSGTIRGQGLPPPEEVEIAAKAGYQGIEPWVDRIRRWVEQGGSVADLKKRIADRGLVVESAISFAQWIPEEPEGKADLAALRRDMELVAQVGGRRIAAPPVGATGQARDLLSVARAYRDALELGRSLGVVPQLELWGASKTLSRLGEVAFVAVEAAHDDACLLLDVYHVYKGGSDFAGLGALNGRRMHVFHMNDYPADPPRATITDADRVYPGDGVAPLSAILGHLWASGFRGVLSLELFNRQYWAQDALEVARTGLAKMREACRAASLS